MDSGDLVILAIWTICLLASLGVSALTGGRWSRRARATAAAAVVEPVAPVPAPVEGPLVLEGFRHGEDVVSLPIAPERAELVVVRPSEDGADGVIAIGDEVVVVVPGVPDLSAADLRLLTA